MATLTNLRPRIAEILSEYETPGAVVGILHRGEVTELAYGVTDIATVDSVTPATVFQCGSLTKSWTALAFMQLVDEGKVALDSPVRTYLPRFRVADPEVSARVTPRNLLNHTSGIEEAYGDQGETDAVYERMVEAIVDAPQVSPLGSTHGYSAALGYAILARIMEVIDDKPWDKIMADRLFDPMGLVDTTTRREDVDLGRAARGHLVRSLEEGPIPTPIDFLPRAFGPSGGISSSVRGILALTHVYLHGGVAANGHRILSAQQVQVMMASRVTIPDPYLLGQEWALGLVASDWRGISVYGHDGSTIGQNARLRMLPDHDLALVLLTNGDDRESLYRRIFNVVLAEIGTVTIPPLPDTSPTLVLDHARYLGVYERPGARFEVTADGDRLRLSVDVDPLQADIMGLPRRITRDLIPIDETHFLIPPATALEEPQTAAIFDLRDGRARYLHTNARLHPRRP